MKKEMKPDMKSEAKKKMLQEMKKMATDMMGSDLNSKMEGMKKVTVASDSEEGLKKGLEMAKDKVEEMPEMEEDMESEEMESEEMEEECSPEELQSKIAKLQAKLDAMKKA